MTDPREYHSVERLFQLWVELTGEDLLSNDKKKEKEEEEKK